MVKNKPTHIVGIGASAGGLEALQSFFENTPSNLGIAFVVIQHLSSDFKSMMDELLKKNTDMRVHQAVEGEEVLANNVYLIPSGKLMRIVEGNIYLSDIPPDSRVNLPINEFFRSLAEDLQNRAIGVVLSGTGSDGSRGVLALKEVGAMVISQDPEEAQFDGMPLSAINTGSVDFVLSTKDMSKQIISFISHPLSSPNSQSKFINHLSEYGDILDKILTLVQEATDLDFKAYKESTVSRRIEHRMSINNAKSLREYYEYLLKSKDEIELIKQDLLIGVTQFFRDHDVWKNIYETIIPNIVSSTESNEPIRIWSVGCSTGEEPYTIAMLFDRKLKELGVNRHIKVFASDIDQSAVGFGTTGVYPASIETEVPRDYLNRYFNSLVNGNYQVTKELRNMVVFATHNLIQDPPFSNMHLISCRNTLIYLQSPAQQKALAFFHFALKLNGYLLLGSAENTGSFGNYFTSIDSKNRTYQKTKDIRIPLSSLTNTDIKHKNYHPTSIPNFIAKSSIKQRSKKLNNRLGANYLFNVFIPPTLIFNERLQVVYTYGDTSLFTTKLREGFVTNDISEILNKHIVSKAISVAHQVLREKKSILFHNVYVSVNSNGERTVWALRASSFTDEDSNELFIVLSFLNNNSTSTSDIDLEYDVKEQTQQRLTELDSSLIECQNLYREALEELDTTREELQSSNEELMAANEELQSTNEELQSVNEELYTVNSEYQQKISELTSANSDLENLLKATKLAVLFLDNNLRIRRFTHAFRKYVNIIDFDIDREFKDLSLKEKFNGLHEIIIEVNQTAKSVLQVFEFDTQTVVEASITPYFIGHNQQGVIISMREIEKDEKRE